MIYIVVFLFVSLCGSIESRPETAASFMMPPNLMDQLNHYALSCLMETGANPSELMNSPILPDDEASKNFYLCTLTKAGLVTAKLKVEDIVSEIHSTPERKAARTLLQKCNKKKGSNPADRIYNIINCLYEVENMFLSFNLA